VVVYTCNPSTQEAEQKGVEAEASLIYIMRSWLREREREREQKKILLK
jgi:hypothetical protein